MKYMILIYSDEKAFASVPDAQRKGRFEAYTAYTKALREAGVLVDGSRLEGAKAATTIRLQNGRRQVQDGPIADTKEQLGGYYIIDAPNADAALDWAVRCPGASYGGVELRPFAAM